MPNPANPQSWNRYSYVENNPIKFYDPSGHRACDDVDEYGKCKIYSDEDFKDGYIDLIKNRYDWDVKKDDFSLDELESIFETGLEIENYVDSITNNNGQEWMNAYLGGTYINRSNWSRGMAIPGRVILPKDWSGSKYYLTHEMAHIWDENSGYWEALGPVDGPGDGLNTFIGGNVVIWGGCRFCDGTGYNRIPEEYRFKSGAMVDNKGRPYGNNSTADYLAESFALNIHYPNQKYVYPDVTLWINSYIYYQASHLH